MMAALQKAMTAAISEVLETMFFTPSEHDEGGPWKADGALDESSTMVCQLDFAGELAGSVWVVVPREVLLDLTTNFMGVDAESVSEDHLKGTLKEFTNMIAGKTFSNIDHQFDLQLGIPAVGDRRSLVGAENSTMASLIRTPSGSFAAILTLEAGASETP